MGLAAAILFVFPPSDLMKHNVSTSMKIDSELLALLYRFCLLLTGDSRNAVLVFDRTIEDAAIRLSQLNSSPKTFQWLVRKARNWAGKALEGKLQAATEESGKARAKSVVENGRQPMAEADAHHEEPALVLAMKELPEKPRVALALFYLNRFSSAEIAELANMSLPQLAIQLKEGRELLKNQASLAAV